MQKAYQQQLLQMTNQQVLAIRQAEINYYVSFFSTFGFQAAAIGGFAYGSLTQIAFQSPAPYGPGVYELIQDFFWVSVATCMGASMHCIITTIFLQVLGPGLAMHGPIGSMGKAADGMRSETNQVFVAYMVMAISFALSNFFCFWCLMDTRSATFSTIVFFAGAIILWRSCFQIYNNLYIEFSETKFGQDDDDVTERESSDPTGSYMPPTVPGASSGAVGQSKVGSAATGNSRAKGGIFGIFSKKADPQQMSEPSVTNPVAASAAAAQQTINMEGFMTMKGSNSTWTRHYFALKPSGSLFMYKSKRDHPKAPINSRPVEVPLHDVLVHISEDEKKVPVFEIRLELKDKEEVARVWVFRCDTEDELEMWQGALQAASALLVR